MIFTSEKEQMRRITYIEVHLPWKPLIATAQASVLHSPFEGRWEKCILISSLILDHAFF